MLSSARTHRPASGPGAEDEGVGTAKRGDPLLERGVGQLVAPLVLALDGRQQVVPDEVEDGLHVEGLAGDGDRHVLLGEHDGVLAVGTVTAVAVPARSRTSSRIPRASRGWGRPLGSAGRSVSWRS